MRIRVSGYHTPLGGQSVKHDRFQSTSLEDVIVEVQKYIAMMNTKLSAEPCVVRRR